MEKDSLESRMREFEDFNPKILKNIWIVARLDGRRFNKLTQKMKLQKPFDESFQCVMAEIVKKIMKDSGVKIIYGYTESDEISLLFHRNDDSFNRRYNKIVSVLPSMASSIFTKQTGYLCSFDCRISHLPSVENVLEYFLWRQNDSHRNALNGYCYWTLRKKLNSRDATKYMEKLPSNLKHDLLTENGINYNNILNWHKTGTGVYFKNTEVNGFNPVKKENILTVRRKIFEDKNLPFGEKYSFLIKNLIIEGEEVRGK